MTDSVTVEHVDGVQVISINRPQARNAINRAVSEAVAAAWWRRRAACSDYPGGYRRPSRCRGALLPPTLANRAPDDRILRLAFQIKCTESGHDRLVRLR